MRLTKKLSHQQALGAARRLLPQVCEVGGTEVGVRKGFDGKRRKVLPRQSDVGRPERRFERRGQGVLACSCQPHAAIRGHEDQMPKGVPEFLGG